MKVRSDFLSHLSSYLEGKMDLKAFREWQLPLLLNREKLTPDEQEFLFTVEAHYGELLAGLTEDSFKESLRNLLPQEAKQAPVQLVSRSYIISASTVLVDFSPSPEYASSGTNYQDNRKFFSQMFPATVCT
jgi:hypothetical protein